MPSAEFEPVIPVKWPQTCSLDRTATGNGS